MEDYVQSRPSLSEELDLPDLETNNRGVLAAPVGILIAAAHAHLDAIKALPNAERKDLSVMLSNCLIAACAQTWIPRPGGRFRCWHVYHRGHTIGTAPTVVEAKSIAAWHVAKLLD